MNSRTNYLLFEQSIVYIPFHPKKPRVAHEYRIQAEAQRAALEKEVNAKLASGIMQCTSDIPLAPSYVVPKKDGKARHAQDIELTDIMAWPLSNQEELVHAIA
jgi:hypothetical protein